MMRILIAVAIFSTPLVVPAFAVTPVENSIDIDASGALLVDGQPREIPAAAELVSADIMDSLVPTVWNECDEGLSGNYLDLPCSTKRFLSDDYAVFLKKNFLSCVNAGLAKARGGVAKRVHILHDGTTADGRHDPNSLHVVGRAVDIRRVDATLENGQVRSFDFTQTNRDRKVSARCLAEDKSLCAFYEGFRGCWHKLHVMRRCPFNQESPIGTLGWEEAGHVGHHLHTSLPFCPNNKGFKLTKR